MITISYLPNLLNWMADNPAMHMPDGFLNLPISLLCWGAAIGFLALAVRRVRGELGERQAPLMGVMAAFIFAAQIINFPVAGGTSGHLLGGALSAIVLGPWQGMLVMACVIGVQGLLFQDGGLLAMGANILNMGLLTVIIAYGLSRSVASKRRNTRLAVGGIAAWLSVMTGALATSLELWLSGTARLNIVGPAMMGVHALIGIGEALITVAALAFIMQTRPDLLETGKAKAKGGYGWIISGVAITLVVVFLAPFATTNPDGLERVAVEMGFIGYSVNAPYAIFPDYSIPLIGETPMAAILAGAIGAMAVAILVVLVAILMRRSTKATSET